ncbi:MAG: orotate phosphoribosyltransferase, partial [Candidatus Micrarchaeota archaeon]
KMLLEKNALRIAKGKEDAFTLKSGRKSPYFVNMGYVTDGEALKSVKDAYAGAAARMIKDGKMEGFDFVFGPAYKGIPLGALMCEGLSELYGMNTKFLYDRKEEKTHGDKATDKSIVGANHFVKGGKILIVDDVITTGRTKLDVFRKLEELGEHKVVGILVAIDRQERMGDADKVEEKSASQFIEEHHGVKVYSIGTMQDIYEHFEKSMGHEAKEDWLMYKKKYGAE